ncbi:MAG: type IV pilus secretin PilQ [Cellvibrionaceae bacterium]
MKKTITLMLSSLALLASEVFAATLENMEFAALPGGKFEIRLGFDSVPPEPKGYAIEKPARLVLDFENVSNAIKEKKHSISLGNAKSAVLLGTEDRTRLVVNLNQLDEYRTRAEGNTLVVEVGSSTETGYIAESAQAINSVSPVASSRNGDVQISEIDFRRGDLGEGRVIVKLTDDDLDIDVQQHGGKIVVSFFGAGLAQELHRRLDVNDFATPVKIIESNSDSGRAWLEITPVGDYDYLAYQADMEYVISVKPLTKSELEERKNKFAYVGEKLSLNFQDIEVRSVLQLIADFTGLNLVASDTVQGRITLRLDNVPWDQALELVLKTKGLDKRQVGNVLMVAPAVEIAERERQEIETQRQLQELAPLRTEFVRIRYADASELFELFGGEGGSSGGSGEGGSGAASTGSILSERGKVIVDERTNTIILTDTDERIQNFLRLVEEIDRPIPQVLIEARIVIANTDFRRELGVRWGVAGSRDIDNDESIVEFGGSTASLEGQGPSGFFAGQQTLDLADTAVVDLAVGTPAGSLAFDILTDNTFLDLELSALQNGGHGEIVSQPKVITGDKQKASIQAGTEIPYQEASSSGATSTSFKEAVLKLEVTPQITPDDNIVMDLNISQDSVGAIDLASGIPTIDVTQLETQVLVGNGKTVVLGGIFQNETSDQERKVPLLGDIPVLGRLFRQDITLSEKREILIFITPKILTDPLRK